MPGRRASSPRLDEVVIVTTSFCNLRCSYCCATGRPGVRAPWPAVRAVLDRLLASPETPVLVAFTGGEPLLARRVISRTVSYVETRRRATQVARLKLMTNGTLLDRQACAWLEDHAFEVQISIDGVRAAQDARYPGTFDQLRGLLRDWRRRSPSYFRAHVGVMMTLTPGTVGTFAESVSSLINAGVGTIKAGPAMDVPPARPGARADLSRQVGQVFQHSLAHYWQTGEVPFAPFRRGPFGTRRAPSPWVCDAPLGRSLTVDADGEVATCLLATRTYADERPLTPAVRAAIHALRVGAPDRRLDHRLKNVRAHPALATVFGAETRSRGAAGPCGRCAWNHECRVCPLTVERVSATCPTVRVPDFICTFNQVIAQYRAQFPVSPPRR
jgi:sulfatase maturation enzyme AslB (radical SAM superfamily)